MANLYELAKAIRDFDLEIDEETGEILNAAELDALELERSEKIENIALWIKNLRADAEAYKREKESFAQKQKVAENKAERLREYLTSALDGEKYKSDRVTISYRKSAAVSVVDAGQIPVELWRLRSEPDKAKIREKLKAGEDVPGAVLEETTSLQIK